MLKKKKSADKSWQKRALWTYIWHFTGISSYFIPSLSFFRDESIYVSLLRGCKKWALFCIHTVKYVNIYLSCAGKQNKNITKCNKGWKPCCYVIKYVLVKHPSRVKERKISFSFKKKKISSSWHSRVIKGTILILHISFKYKPNVCVN